MVSYKWYKPSELLPEETDLEKDKLGIKGFFVVSLTNGDLCCVTRWLEGPKWYWDTDNEYNDNLIQREGITHWMRIEGPIDN